MPQKTSLQTAERLQFLVVAYSASNLLDPLRVHQKAWLNMQEIKKRRLRFEQAVNKLGHGTGTVFIHKPDGCRADDGHFGLSFEHGHIGA